MLGKHTHNSNQTCARFVGIALHFVAHVSTVESDNNKKVVARVPRAYILTKLMTFDGNDIGKQTCTID